MGHNPGVPLRKPLATALLLLAAAAMPQLLWVGAHAFGHHEHGEEAAGHGAVWSGHAKALVHGHEHGEGDPDHEHYLRPSPPLRPDAPENLQTPAMVSLATPEPEHVPLPSAQGWRGEIRFSGSGPPGLHLLCTLLI